MVVRDGEDEDGDGSGMIRKCMGHENKGKQRGKKNLSTLHNSDELHVPYLPKRSWSVPMLL